MDEAMAVSENADNLAGETSSRANTSSGDETNQMAENRKRKEREGSSSEPLHDGEDESHVRKKKRVIWTSEMHRKFVDAIAQIGEDKAFPKKIVEVMNEPELTRENVASHLQKYRISLKKSQEERDRYFQGLNAAAGNDKTAYIHNSSLGNYHHYLGTSQLSAKHYLPISTSSCHSSLYGITTGIGASRVRLAPPSYSVFDALSLPISSGNMHKQYSRRTKVNESFGDYGGEQRSIFLGTMNRKPCSDNSDDHTTSSSTSNNAFMGLQIADDGKSLLFGSSNRSEIISTENYLITKRSDFHYQESVAPKFPSFNIESYAQDSPLPPLPDFKDQKEEHSLPPLPEFYVESSLPQLEAEENEFIDFILQQETHNGTSLTDDMNSFSLRRTGTSLDQQNSLQSSALENLKNTKMEQITQIFSNNHMEASRPTISTSPWNSNSNMGSYSLINQEVLWNMHPDSPTSSSIPQMNQQGHLPHIQSESQWNVYPDALTTSVNNNIQDQENLLPGSPYKYPWNLDLDPVTETYDDNFFDEQM